MSITDIGTRLTSLLKDSGKRANLLLLLGGAAMLLVLMSGQSCSPPDKEPTETVSEQDYARELEVRLEEIISSVKGAGEARVMVTLQSGTEYIYASEDATSNDRSQSVDSSGRQSSDEREDRQSSHIIIDTDRGEQALIRTELMPSVNGVVVVCGGADDPEVAERIMAVVTTALGISSKRVCITQLSQ